MCLPRLSWEPILPFRLSASFILQHSDGALGTWPANDVCQARRQWAECRGFTEENERTKPALPAPSVSSLSWGAVSILGARIAGMGGLCKGASQALGDALCALTITDKQF